MKNKCTQCGQCCKSEVCEYGIKAGIPNKIPCQALIKEKKGYSCMIVNQANKIGGGVLMMIIIKLGIGRGCTNDFKLKGKRRAV
jgi:hypothetical protein